MAESENNAVAAPPSRADARVAVIVPLFPPSPGLRASLASLGAQTQRPDLVVLVDDGTGRGAEEFAAQLRGLAIQIVQTEQGGPAAAFNAVTQCPADFEFVALLRGGDFYAPERLERCIAALEAPAGTRTPAMVVTGWRAVDSRGQPLPAKDSRARHLELLWAPGRAGAGLAEWLGSGYFPGPLSNIFARRAYLAATRLPEDAFHVDQIAVVLAALQGHLTVLQEPLLDHYPPAPERNPTQRQTAEALRTQLAVLSALRGKLPVSPETRRNAAAYHRAAWNNLSGLREDLFQQLVLQLAAAAAPEDTQAALSPILRSHEAQTMPAHWEELLEGRDPLDLAAYADALRRARAKLDEVRAENERLRVVAGAAQDSGWVRFGAWLGDRGARRIMQLEEEQSSHAGVGNRNETGS